MYGLIGSSRERMEHISLTWWRSAAQSEAMSGVPATTVFGAGDIKGLVSQLNLWTPQIELTLQELRGAQFGKGLAMQSASLLFSTQISAGYFRFFWKIVLLHGLWESVGCRLTYASQFGPFEAGCTLGKVGAACLHVLPPRRTKNDKFMLQRVQENHATRKEPQKRKTTKHTDQKRKTHEQNTNRTRTEHEQNTNRKEFRKKTRTGKC